VNQNPNKSGKYNAILIGKYETKGTPWKIYTDRIIIFICIIKIWAARM